MKSGRLKISEYPRSCLCTSVSKQSLIRHMAKSKTPGTESGRNNKILKKNYKTQQTEHAGTSNSKKGDLRNAFKRILLDFFFAPCFKFCPLSKLVFFLERLEAHGQRLRRAFEIYDLVLQGLETSIAVGGFSFGTILDPLCFLPGTNFRAYKKTCNKFLWNLALLTSFGPPKTL